MKDEVCCICKKHTKIYAAGACDFCADEMSQGGTMIPEEKLKLAMANTMKSCTSGKQGMYYALAFTNLCSELGIEFTTKNAKNGEEDDDV